MVTQEPIPQRSSTIHPTVVHVISTPSGFGGAERILSSLVDEGIERGWRQIVMNPFDRDPEGSVLSLSFRGRVRYEARITSRPWQLPAARAWLRDRISDAGADIVHVHLFHALALVTSLSRPSGTRLILSQHHGDYLAWRGRKVQALLDKIATNKCDRVVACSYYVQKFLLSNYNLPPERVTTILNGWEGEVSTNLPKHSRPTVICVANFRPEKAHDVLIRSFRTVVNEVPDAQLFLVGSGPLEADLRKRVTANRLDDSVVFTGSVADVWPLLSQAHVFALSSRFELLGIVVMEAMAAGLPVVATRAGGIPEIVKEGLTGHLVDVDDHALMARHLIKLLRSADLRESMASAATLSAESLGTQQMLSKYFELYEEEFQQSSSRKGPSAS